MKKNFTLLLIGLLSVLAIIVYFMLAPTDERESSYSIDDLQLSVDSTKISKISVERNKIPTHLEEAGGIWFVTQLESHRDKKYRADQDAVKRLISGLNKLKVTSLISSNPAKQGIYQVDNAGTLITVSQRDGKKAEFVLGKMGPSFSETYIRPASSNDVYLSEGLMSWDVSKEPKDWRDKTMFTLIQDSISSIEYQYAKDQFAITKDSIWRIGKDTAVTANVTGMLSSLASLRAEDFIDSTHDISNAQFQLKLREKTDVSLTFVPLPPDSARYILKTSLSPQLFIVNKWSVQPIIKQQKDFLPEKKK